MANIVYFFDFSKFYGRFLKKSFQTRAALSFKLVSINSFFIFFEFISS